MKKNTGDYDRCHTAEAAKGVYWQLGLGGWWSFLMRRRAASLLYTLLAVLLPQLGSATSVQSESVGEILERAELVFEGQVLTLETRSDGTPSSIRPCARFAVLDVIKGDVGDNVIELCFAGGRVGVVTRWVSGMTYPAASERGIYFVESRDRRRVHPLCGWQQGHFLILPEPAGGPGRMTTVDGQQVEGVELNDQTDVSGSSRIARGIGVGGTNRRGAQSQTPRAGATQGKAEPPAGLTPEAFKARLLSLIQNVP
jgi:hypothetical protein